MPSGTTDLIIKMSLPQDKKNINFYIIYPDVLKFYCTYADKKIDYNDFVLLEFLRIKTLYEPYYKKSLKSMADFLGLDYRLVRNRIKKLVEYGMVEKHKEKNKNFYRPSTEWCETINMNNYLRQQKKIEVLRKMGILP